MILVLAGTQDGRELAAYLTRHGFWVTVSVVSQYGKQLAEGENLTVEVGALDQEGLYQRIHAENITLVVDATHPYAVNVLRNAISASNKAGIHYLRYERVAVPLPDYAKLYSVTGFTEAADTAAKLGQTVFLTTGSRQLKTFTSAPSLFNHRLVTRVLPDVVVIAQCLNLGLTPKDIIAMQGPFSHELNAALFKAYQADVIISKNSGTIGGSDTKITAAMELELPIVVIDRPEIKYPKVAYTAEEVLAYAGKVAKV
ncbi:MAG: precorrin-6A reductase [Pelosinus sp.]|nr:precorrin-6A reductase [Pelosinus sp.]